VHIAKHYTELIKEGREAENNGEAEEAAGLFEKAIKQEPLIELPYNRLMVIYRKQKEYEKELKVLDKALEVFINHYDKKLQPYKGNTKLAQLSKALLKAVSGREKNTSYTYPEPIPKWTIRRKNLEEKIKP
jgi:tetratricopeptide (TPR) repeat protein